ncbi:ankyrin repeat-containing domain protein [Aspergillus pseudotamarii]|uniref:Ankyrin repeat-containing domain protein n=1 Tax=Aspergillus pseudotamarii TaxID=132259 RepID=A0A5N6SEP6_ASPPS|nr:ankyrin repeat-containing domain protein [Aspergillus pseudotamarii]KAE8132407.1 ankyrin repeat-containing domain protein [Aspergillus pseudotamarii]
MSFSQFHNPSTLAGDPWDSGLRDTDGSILYEADWKVLRDEIIRRNDVETLKRYIEKYPETGLEPELVYYYHEVFFVATRHGCVDALRVLLAYYLTNLDKAVPLEERDIVLLSTACRYAQLETVHFLLDSQPPLGNIRDKSSEGETALLSAANDQIEEHLARSEQLMYMLLDRDASVHDVTMVRNEYNTSLPPQPRNTVLSLAISRASYKLVKRLIEQGANVHAKQEHVDARFGFKTDLRDVTALHYGSIYWNIEGVRALLDHPGNAKIADMVSVRDTIGDDTREQERYFREDEILPRYIDILKILLTANPSTINMQDNEGSIALHYVDIIQFLCENGAGASISNYEGKTMLHLLALCSRDCDPIDTATDKSGATALHAMSMCLRQIPILKYLLKLGADATIQDSEGNTPLHKLMTRPYLRTKNVTLTQRIAALDKIMVALQEAGKVNMMNQPNAAGQTSQQLRAKIVAMLQKADEHRIEQNARGGQGYGH